MASTPIETLLEGKVFSCQAGGNWTSGKRQGIGCVAFGACDIHSSTKGTKKGGDRTISPYIGYQKGGGRIVCLKQTGDGLYCCLCSRERRGKRWSGLQSMGEKGGTWSESRVGMGGIEWPKNRMISRRISSLVDRARFLLPGHKGWRSLGGDEEHVRRKKEPDVLKLALKEGVEPQEGVGWRGWKRGTQ